MALMKRANREINVPENHVEEYLDKGYSLIDSNGTVLRASNPQTVEDFRGLVAALKGNIASLEAEKATLLEECESMKKQLKALDAKISASASAETKKTSKSKES